MCRKTGGRQGQALEATRVAKLLPQRLPTARFYPENTLTALTDSDPSLQSKKPTLWA